MNIRVIFFTVLFFALGTTSVTAFAAIFCYGKIVRLAFNPDTSVLQVDAEHGVHYLCKFAEMYNDVEPATCKAWYAMFLTAKITGATVVQAYQGVDQCLDLGNWQVPVVMPYYVGLQ